MNQEPPDVQDGFRKAEEPEIKLPPSARSGSMHETGCSGLVHWDDPEGWDGE